MVHNNETFGALSTLVTVNVIAVENVIWGNLTGTSASGNNLTSTAPNGWGNSGAASTRALASGDGYVEFTANEVNLSRMCGLNNGDTNQTFQEIDYAIYVAYDATIEVWENGIYRGDYGTYQANDRFRISVEGGVVKYSKGGTVFYTSTVAPSYPLRVDTALAHTNATLTNVIISGTLQYVPQNVFWIGNTTNVGINGNSLTKNAGSDAAWDGGAVSSLALAPGDGYVEFEASETTTDRLVGLSYSGAVPNYWGIDFGIRQYYGSLYLIESNGANLGSFGTYAAHDGLRIAVENGAVNYYKISQGTTQLQQLHSTTNRTRRFSSYRGEDGSYIFLGGGFGIPSTPMNNMVVISPSGQVYTGFTWTGLGFNGAKVRPVYENLRLKK
jgi:hypothetical protein